MEEQPGAWDAGLAEVEENGHMSHGKETPQVSPGHQQEQPTTSVFGVTPEGARHAPSHTAGKWQGSSCVGVICPSLLPHY